MITQMLLDLSAARPESPRSRCANSEPAEPMKRIRWPDGRTSHAATWRELLRAWRREQFRDYGPLAFRLAMRRRAKTWSGACVCLFCGCARFARELAACGM